MTRFDHRCTSIMYTSINGYDINYGKSACPSQTCGMFSPGEFKQKILCIANVIVSALLQTMLSYFKKSCTCSRSKFSIQMYNISFYSYSNGIYAYIVLGQMFYAAKQLLTQCANIIYVFIV